MLDVVRFSKRKPKSWALPKKDPKKIVLLKFFVVFNIVFNALAGTKRLFTET